MAVLQQSKPASQHRWRAVAGTKIGELIDMNREHHLVIGHALQAPDDHQLSGAVENRRIENQAIAGPRPEESLHWQRRKLGQDAVFSDLLDAVDGPKARPVEEVVIDLSKRQHRGTRLRDGEWS